MSYTIDVYRGDAKMQKNFITFGAYVALFPQLIAGPIVRFKDVAEQLDHRKETISQFSKGILRFMVGLGKESADRESSGGPLEPDCGDAGQ